jgi:hypothetical protein
VAHGGGEVESGFVNLLWGAATSPLQYKKRCLEERHKVDDNKDNNQQQGWWWWRRGGREGREGVFAAFFVSNKCMVTLFTLSSITLLVELTV